MSKRPGKTDHDPSVTEVGDGDAFLSRWARRKRIARSGENPDAQERETPVDDEMLARAAPDAAGTALEGDDGEAVELTDEDMPPVDAIDENTDMSGFFSPKVTQAVKKAALRKFFHSPAFNIVDGLDDYDDDFRNFAALGDIVTSDMRGQMEREAERAREGLAKDGEDAGPEASAEPPVESLEESDAPPPVAADEPDSERPREAAADEPGITRDPATSAKAGPGKLRPRDADDVDA
jgi:hypothetical protein